MDTEGAADLIEYDASVDDLAISEHYLGNGTEYEQVLEVPGGGVLRATICWNDPAANSGAAVALINDLDIRITEISSGTTTMPWVLNGSTSNPASHGDNTADNVEQIYISGADAGAYTLTVSHKGTLQGGIQAFSLIITGATDGQLPEISLVLTPVSNYIMPGGGTLSYDVDFSYNGANPIPGSSYWVDLILPNGNSWGPLFQYNFTINPGQTISTTLNHHIPGYAPGGTYTVIGKVGTYPGTVLVSDEFEMVKFGTAPGGANGSWLESDPSIAGDGGGFELPEAYTLSEAYPNPFNPSTSFSLQLPEAADVSIAVYNVSGRLVSTVADGRFQAGSHQFSVDGSNLAAGVYFLRAIVPGQLSEVRKLALVK
ncbi:hypothetical protein BMS3Bbin04_01214 [bacterium BMS3Bbin04]|nr:hypothetical protein BMS3Bbin04_01214 [bacterium BMS3Bbin04]